MTTKGRSGQTDKTMWKTEQKVKTYVEKFHMIEPGDTIVLGISGGADSVCLLKILSKWKESWGISLKAVHVHHQLRGKEADDDEAFVRRLCEGEGIVCQVFHEDVQGIANREKKGLEEAGRLARYRCFTKVCEEVGGGKIALAHHQDDLAETMLHHLVRGTGIAGLCSLKPVSGNRIRPLLCLGKEEILAYLEEAGQSWRTDSSNLEDDYTRNRIRHHVLEELKTEVNPQAVRHMAQLSEELEEARSACPGGREREKTICKRRCRWCYTFRSTEKRTGSDQPADHTHTFKRDFRETEEFYQNPYRSGAAVMETKGRGKKRSSL